MQKNIELWKNPPKKKEHNGEKNIDENIRQPILT